MQPHDFDRFCKVLDAACELRDKTMTAGAKALFFASMQQYPMPVVEKAIAAHLQDPKAGMYQMMPAHLIAKIEGGTGGDGRPGAEEAWAIAITSQDEAETVIWTHETAAAFAICQPVLALGDEVGARMAFKEAYSRMVAAARAASVNVFWSASLGWDVRKREVALSRASLTGLLPAPAAAALLPPPVDLPPADSNARTQLDKIRQMLVTMHTERQLETELHARRERQATADAKARADRAVANYKRGEAA